MLSADIGVIQSGRQNTVSDQFCGMHQVWTVASCAAVHVCGSCSSRSLQWRASPSRFDKKNSYKLFGYTDAISSGKREHIGSQFQMDFRHHDLRYNHSHVCLEIMHFSWLMPMKANGSNNYGTLSSTVYSQSHHNDIKQTSQHAVTVIFVYRWHSLLATIISVIFQSIPGP